ncbi:MAG: hypothetical protein ACXACI_10365 [Candidatus Hodarchaeales archaeon]
MDKKIAIVYFLVLMLSLLCFAPTDPNALEKVGAATTENEWTTTFGGTADEGALSIIQTTDEGFALAGWTRSYGAGGQDFWLIKADTNRQTEWNNTFGGTSDDWALSIIQTADGGFALAGITKSYGAGDQDFWLVKTDTNGQHEWNITFGGAANDVFRSVTQTVDGGFALLGGTWSYGAGDQDIWLVKTDANGQPEWNETYGGVGAQRGLSVIQTPDGDYAISGGSMLIKTDNNGQHEWNTTLGVIGHDFLNVIIQTSDGGFALAGGSDIQGAGEYDFLLIKTDANGQPEWDRTYGGTADDGSNWDDLLVQTADGGFAFGGWTESYGAGGKDVWLIRTDSTGQAEWTKTFGGTADDWANSLIQTTDGGFALAGVTESYGAGGRDVWLVKTNGSEPKTSDTDSGLISFMSWYLVIATFVAVIAVRSVKMSSELKRKPKRE